MAQKKPTSKKTIRSDRRKGKDTMDSKIRAREAKAAARRRGESVD